MEEGKHPATLFWSGFRLIRNRQSLCRSVKHNPSVSTMTRLELPLTNGQGPLEDRDDGQELARAQWYVVFTKPRSEALAEDNLRRQGFRCLLPRIQQARTRRNKRLMVTEPLFPRYLFVQLDPDRQSIAPIRSTLGVTSMVRFGGELAVVPEPIIATLLARTDRASGLVSLQSPCFTPGDKVMLLDGPLAGIQGIFEAASGEERVIMLLDLLGRQVRVTAPRSSVGCVV